ncbi:MAG: rhodanese-like domain-containing protein [Bryobacteraceae bacterium]
MRTVGILSCALLAALVVAQQSSETSAKKATPEEIRAMLGSSQKVFFLDVRSPKELEELGTLPGYVNIPLVQLENRLSEVPKHRLIITACNRAARAAKAAAILEKAGYKHVMLCAMNDWKEKGYPVIYPKAAAKPEGGSSGSSEQHH